MLKIDSYLSDLGFSEVNEQAHHEDFVAAYNELKKKIEEDPEGDYSEEDEKLLKMFPELHDITDEPEPTPNPTPEPTPEPTPKPTPEPEKEEKEKKEAAKQKVIDLFNKKVNWSYEELASVGIDPNKLGLSFEVEGFVFEKRHLMKVYSIVEKPKVQ